MRGRAARNCGRRKGFEEAAGKMPTGQSPARPLLRWGRMWVKENPARFREGVPGQGFRDGIASHRKGKSSGSRHLSVPSRRAMQGGTGVRAMYSGMLIDELIA